MAYKNANTPHNMLAAAPGAPRANAQQNELAGETTAQAVMSAAGAADDESVGDEQSAIELYQLCASLQTEIESAAAEAGPELVARLRSACTQAEQYLQSRADTQNLFCDYLRMICRDFRTRICQAEVGWSDIGAESYGLYSTRVKRTGWLRLGIPDCESVAEHTYYTWLLGVLLLKDDYPEVPGYSKDTILSLLLIHDLSEAVTGDIPTPEKCKSQAAYDRAEACEMAILTLRGSYPNQPEQLKNYALFQKWDCAEDINGCIAKELDKIQMMYQALCYARDYPELMTPEQLREFMQSEKKIRTIPGRAVYETVIEQNRAFSDILKGI